MNMKRIVAMMALATVLSSGVTAHAEVVNNPNSTKTLSEYVGLGDVMQQQTTNIEINGTFNKQATNLPDPENEGHYLYVTMPISLDYVYDVDTDKMTSAAGKVINQSFQADEVGGVLVQTSKKIKMTIEDLTKATDGTNSINVKYVNKVDSNSTDAVQAPFKLNVLNKDGGNISSHNLADIADKNVTINTLDIPANETIQLQLAKIDGQDLGNKELIKDGTVVTKHALELKFEYVN